MSRMGIRHLDGRAGARQLRLLAAAGTGACLLAAGTAAWLPSAAQASSLTFTVNTTADAHAAHPGEGICADAAGQCTLRAALEVAAASPSGSTVRITVPAGTYDLTLGSLTLGSGAVPVKVTVDGAGAASTVVAATGGFRVMAVTPHTTGLVEDLEITGGKAGSNFYGGGIFSRGVLTLSHDTLIGNTAGAGGGVANSGGTLTVTGSTIEKNHGRYFGGGGIQNGGPLNLPGTVVVQSSTISGNVTSNEGGGIFSGQNGHPAESGQPAVAPRRLCSPARCAAPRFAAAAGLVLHVINSTVSGNLGGNGGGGIAAAQGTATLAGSRVNNNSAGAAIGGGLFDVGTVTGSTISDNTASTGGGVEDSGLAMTIKDSTLDGNRGIFYGGALEVSRQVTVSQSTIVGNIAGHSFGPTGAVAEIQGSATLIISDSTVAGNITQPAGRGAIDNFGGTLILSFATLSGSQGLLTGSTGFDSATGTILAGNGTTPNCSGALSETAGYNLSTDSSCGLSKTTDLTGANPMLKPLANNGGPTMTQALSRSSPAVNAGGLPASSSCPAADQRGQSRPFGPACDIGAFELH